MKILSKSRRGIAVLIIVIVLILTTAHGFGWLRPLENLAGLTFSPVQNFFSESAWRVKNFFVYFNDIGKLKEENDELKNKLASLTAENLRLRLDLESSQTVAELLAYTKEHQYSSSIAKIIGRNSDAYAQILIINRGTADGVKNGYPVVASSGIIVGKITEANSRISKVLLLSDNHSQISAKADNVDGSPGIISGQYGITLLMEMVPQEKKLEKGELVITSGLEPFIPSGLIVGEIAAVEKHDGQLFQQATVEPMVDYQQISLVSVILPAND